MSKFRSAIIAVTLAAIFFIPLSAIPESPHPIEEDPPQVSSGSGSSASEEEPPEPSAEKTFPEGFFRIFDLETEEISEVSYEDYIKGAIASEMGADFEYDALVAQGIAAFSCGLYQKNARPDADYDFSAAPESKLGYMTEEKAKEIYGEVFLEKWAVICKAAEESAEYVLTYDEKPALTVYHAMSNGMTESSENVWSGALPYLVPVKSPGDKLSPDYESKVVLGRQEVLEALNRNGAGLSGKLPEEWFSGGERTASGYIDRIKIGAATFSGEKLRSIFGLRSADFDVDYKDGDFIFTVRGYGHGVGLSQIGANHMAKEGASFTEILLHYFPGTKLIKYSELQ